ncbi:MAG TPA: ABC transporter permease [Pyrinomonadaceae bacterium]|nr:ABC transporter permease [Pyrinomonadaceae bacterium]
METLFQDVRFALRTLWTNRGFALVAVAALALGVGANSAIFSVVNAVVLRPLPYKDPERLVALWVGLNQKGFEELEVSAPEFTDFRTRSSSFERVAAYSAGGFNMTGAGEPERIQGLNATADLFPALGVAPLKGRAFTEEEDRPGGDGVVVISHSLWRRRFGGDANVIGKSVTLDGQTCTVVGVMPASFHFPDNDTDIWKPMAFDAEMLGPNNRGSHFLSVVGRLKEGVGVEGASAEVAALARTVGGENATTYPRGLTATLRPLQEEVVGESVRRPLFVMLGAVGLVLLIACANVANLLLARAASRRKEVAVRTALGASRARIVRQLLTESLLLSLAGGACGLVLALWGVDLLVALAPAGTPRVEEVGLDARVVGFTFAVSLFTGVVFGLAPALHASKVDLNESLKEGSRGSTEGPKRGRLRGALVVAEFAIALVLLAGAGLLLKSFARVQEESPGFDASNVLTMRVVLPEAKYRGYEEHRAFYSNLFARLRRLPGVEAVGANNLLPFNGSVGSRTFLIEGRPVPPGQPKPEEQLRFVTPGYFEAMRVPLLRGRDFGERDINGEPRVAVVSRSMAERHWPGEDALGKHIAYSGIKQGDKPDWIEIVGVVGDVKHRGLDIDSRPEIYVPVNQPLFASRPVPPLSLYVAMRTKGDPASLAPAARREVLAVDPEQPVANMKTMRQRIDESVAPRRFNMALLGLFACVAVALAAVGIYGVMSYAVARRTHEIGVRVALGAQGRDVLRLVLSQGMWLAVAGVGAGLAIAYGATRVMSSLLYGVSATDTLTFALVSLLLTAAALLACLIPAWRATKVDPMEALRYE